MPYKVSQSITGVEGVRAALLSLPKKIGRKLERKGVNNASKLLLRAVKGQVPRRAYISSNLTYEGGLMKKSLGRKVWVAKKSGVIVGMVGARVGYKQQIGVRVRGKKKGQPIYADPTKYLHLVNLGTVRSKRDDFLDRSLRECLPQCLTLIRDSVAEAIAEMGKGGD